MVEAVVGLVVGLRRWRPMLSGVVASPIVASAADGAAGPSCAGAGASPLGPRVPVLRALGIAAVECKM